MLFLEFESCTVHHRRKPWNHTVPGLFVILTKNGRRTFRFRPPDQIGGKGCGKQKSAPPGTPSGGALFAYGSTFGAACRCTVPWRQEETSAPPLCGRRVGLGSGSNRRSECEKGGKAALAQEFHIVPLIVLPIVFRQDTDAFLFLILLPIRFGNLLKADA